MQQYLRTRYFVFTLIACTLAVVRGFSTRGEGSGATGGAYNGKYIPLKWAGSSKNVWSSVLDPQLRYFVKIDNGRIQIWTFSADFTSGEIVYDNGDRGNEPLQRESQYEATGFAVATKGGLAYVADYPYASHGESSGYKLLLWNPESRETKRLPWGDEFGKLILANPGGTELTRFHPESDKRQAVVEICNLNGQPIRRFKVEGELPNSMCGLFLMDKWDNIYVSERRRDQTNCVLGMIRSDKKSHDVISRGTQLLQRDSQTAGELYKSTPLLLADGSTLATYVRDVKDGRILIEFYREGKLVKSANDPVPNDGAEARLAITADGKGVMTQRTSGDEKGLIGVWDIETGKYSEIVKSTEVRYVFPWVQGRYAPVWTTTDGETYEGGILEISRMK